MSLTKLQELIKLLPAATLFLVLAGILKLYIYYNEFGIKINDFIDPSEVIISFVDDAMTFFVLFGASILTYFFTQSFIKEIGDESLPNSVIVLLKTIVPLLAIGRSCNLSPF